jgi:hypothetical protein
VSLGRQVGGPGAAGTAFGAAPLLAACWPAGAAQPVLRLLCCTAHVGGALSQLQLLCRAGCAVQGLQQCQGNKLLQWLGLQRGEHAHNLAAPPRGGCCSCCGRMPQAQMAAVPWARRHSCTTHSSAHHCPATGPAAKSAQELELCQDAFMEVRRRGRSWCGVDGCRPFRPARWLLRLLAANLRPRPAAAWPAAGLPEGRRPGLHEARRALLHGGVPGRRRDVQASGRMRRFKKLPEWQHTNPTAQSGASIPAFIPVDEERADVNPHLLAAPWRHNTAVNDC